MKKILLLLLVVTSLSACANPQIKHPEYKQSPCSCLEIKWRGADVIEEV